MKVWLHFQRESLLNVRSCGTTHIHNLHSEAKMLVDQNK